MPKSMPLHTPPSFQRYDCQMCGACCRAGFAVVATEEERARILAQGWESHPATQGKQLFIRQIGGQYVLGQNSDGSCIFLDENNACRIHARFGIEGKPFACRPYPFVFLPTGGQMRVSLRFDCPSVVSNEGRPLPEHRAALNELSPLAVPAAAASLPPPLFRPGVTLEWRDLFQVARAFDYILAVDSLDITRRLLACTDLLGLLRGAKMDGLSGNKLEEFLRFLSRNLATGVAENPLERKQPGGLVPPLFRQAAGLYGRLDRLADTRISLSGKVVRLGQRLNSSLRLLGGTGRMPRLRPDLPEVRLREVEQSFGVPDADAAEVLTRYYRVKIDSLGFCGRAFYNWPFLEGLGALLLTYPLILWYARLFAIGEGKSALDADTVQRAVRVIDRPRGVSIPLSVRPERIRMSFLSEHENLTTLLVWYGT